MFNLFAAEGGGVPLAAEPIFNFLGLPITNSMLFGMIIAGLVLTLFTLAAQRSTVRPHSKFAFVVESLMEFVLKLGEDNLGSRKKAIKFMPLLLTLFTFILFSNLSGLIPGVGSINVAEHGEDVPLLRAFTADLNATLAMAILTIGTIQFVAIRELGIKKHLKHYFSVINPWWNPMNAFIGTIEVMGEFIRMVTLSMRLFGVIYAGEVLLHVIGDISGNFAPIATLPVYMLEIFFSLIQAYLFIMLASVYLSLASKDEHGDKEMDENPDVTPVAKLKPVEAK